MRMNESGWKGGNHNRWGTEREKLKIYINDNRQNERRKGIFDIETWKRPHEENLRYRKISDRRDKEKQRYIKDDRDQDREREMNQTKWEMTERQDILIQKRINDIG